MLQIWDEISHQLTLLDQLILRICHVLYANFLFISQLLQSLQLLTAQDHSVFLTLPGHFSHVILDSSGVRDKEEESNSWWKWLCPFFPFDFKNMGPNLTQVVEDNSEPIGIPGCGQASHFCLGCSCLPILLLTPSHHPLPKSWTPRTKPWAIARCLLRVKS